MLERKSIVKLGLLMLSGTLASTVPVIVAMADDSNDDVEDSPIANDSSERILTIHKYLSDSSDGAAGNGTSTYNPTNKTSLAGIKFQIDKVSFKDGTKPDASDSSTYKVDKSDYNTITTDSSGIATEDFGKGTTNDGVYLVTEQDNSDVKTKAAPFFVQIPMTYRGDSDQNKIQYHVTVYPKNSVSDGMNFLSTVNIHGSNPDESANQAGGQANVDANDNSNFQDPTSSGQKDVWNLTSMIPGLSVNGSKTSGDLKNSHEFTEYARIFTPSNDTSLDIIKTGFGLSYVDNNGKAQFDKDLSDQFTEGTDYTISTIDFNSQDPIQKQLNFISGLSSSKILKIDFTAAGRQKILQLAQDQADNAKPTDSDYHKKLFFTTNLTTKTPKPDSSNSHITSISYSLESGLAYTGSTGVQNLIPADYNIDSLNAFGVTITDTDKSFTYLLPTTMGENIALQKYDQSGANPNNFGPSGPMSILSLNNVLADDSDDSNSPGPKFLPGAEFKIADTEANARAGKFIKIDSQGNLYYPGQEGYGNSGQNDYSQTSDNHGQVEFGLLRASEKPIDIDYMDIEKYWAVETKAPTGYELDKSPIPVGTGDDQGFEDVGDVPQTDFPLTGGHILLLVAFVVIASGTGYYIYQKSKKNKIEK